MLLLALVLRDRVRSAHEYSNDDCFQWRSALVSVEFIERLLVICDFRDQWIMNLDSF